MAKVFRFAFAVVMGVIAAYWACVALFWGVVFVLLKVLA